MKELINITNKDGDLIVSSREISKNFEKRHDQVLRDIDRMLERAIISKTDIRESNYKDSYGRKQRMYLVSPDVLRLFNLRSKISTSNYGVIENEYIEIIEDIFPNARLSRQHQFCNGKYLVDLYFLDFGIVVEIDEKDHLYTSVHDEEREKEIIKELYEEVSKEEKEKGIEREIEFDYSRWFKFVRIKEGHLGSGLRDLLIAIESITWNSPTMFMRS